MGWGLEGLTDCSALLHPQASSWNTWLALIPSALRCLVLVCVPTLMASQAHKAKQKTADRTEGSQDRNQVPTRTPWALALGPVAWRPLRLHWDGFLWSLLLPIITPESDPGWAEPGLCAWVLMATLAGMGVVHVFSFCTRTFLTLPPTRCIHRMKDPRNAGMLGNQNNHRLSLMMGRVGAHTRTRRGWHWPLIRVAKRMSFSITQMGQSISTLSYELSILAFYSLSLSFLSCKRGIIIPTS